MANPFIDLARGRLRLSSAIVLGLLCAAAALFALDPAAQAAATALALPPPVALNAPQNVTVTVARGLGEETHYATAQMAQADGAQAGLPRQTAPELLTPQSGGIKYNDTASYSGFYYNQDAAATVGSNGITRLVADDLTLAEPVDGLQVTQLSISVHNANAATVTVRLRFWYDDGTAGAPGTYFLNASGGPIGYTTNAIAFPPGLTLVSFLLGPGFSFPAGRTKFWAGIAYDNNNGATGATLTGLSNFGQGIFETPTVGSSTDKFFESTAAGDFFATSNPAGNALASFGGSPKANFAWRFVFDNICPTQVITTADSGAGSLRSALACATPGDTITFNLAPNAVITLTSGELLVTKTLTIDGSGAGRQG